MYTSDEIYIWFRDNLKRKLESTTIEDFSNAWSNGLVNKTNFYRQFFSGLVEDSSRFVGYEEFRCDMTIYDKEHIPLVLIETENNHQDASTEIDQLCCFHAPLKVLVLSCAWYDSEREKWLHHWQKIIEKYNAAYPTNSKFCIVVGEWGRGKPDDEILRYYLITLSSNGSIIEDLVWTLQ